jgi:hypothetical protein
MVTSGNFVPLTLIWMVVLWGIYYRFFGKDDK